MNDRDGRAIDAVGVRGALRRDRLRAWAVAIGGLLLFSGFAAAATVVNDRAEELESSGLRVDGVVVSYTAGNRLTSARVDVSFTVDSEDRTEEIQLNNSSPRFTEGDHVAVLVDPDDPDLVSIAGETNQSRWSVWVMVVAFVGGLLGLLSGPWSLFRVRRQRDLLTAEPWRSVPVQYAEVPAGNTKRGLVLITENGAGHVLSMVSSARWNLSRSGLRDAHEAQIVGNPAEYVVIRVEGSERLTSARKPLTELSRRRWRRLFDDEP